MQKKKINRIKSIALLLLYVFSISPTFLFHHHNDSVVSYEKASRCEKAIYYADKEEACHHAEHLSKTYEKCNFCDNHTLSSHSELSAFVFSIRQTISSEYQSTECNYHYTASLHYANRGPPRV